MTEPLPIVLPDKTKKRIADWILSLQTFIKIKEARLTPRQHELELKEKIKRMRERQARRARAGL